VDASLCPTLAFAAPTTTEAPARAPCTAASAPASVGSPSAVLMPCASTLQVHSNSAATREVQLSALSSNVLCADGLSSALIAGCKCCGSGAERDKKVHVLPAQTPCSKGLGVLVHGQACCTSALGTWLLALGGSERAQLTAGSCVSWVLEPKPQPGAGSWVSEPG